MKFLRVSSLITLISAPISMFVKFRATKSSPCFDLVVSIFFAGDAGAEGDGGGAASCTEEDGKTTSGAEGVIGAASSDTEGGGGAASSAEGVNGAASCTEEDGETTSGAEGGGEAASCADMTLVMTSPARSRAIVFFTLGLRLNNERCKFFSKERQYLPRKTRSTMKPMNTEGLWHR